MEDTGNILFTSKKEFVPEILYYDNFFSEGYP
jgi:hypothetical protein